MKRFHAFTLLEAVLSLFLVALLGTFAFQVLDNMRSSATRLNDRWTWRQELLFFNTAIRADLDRCTTVRSRADGSVVCSSINDSVHYRVDAQGVHRMDANGDTSTFYLPVEQAQAFTFKESSLSVHCWRIQLNDNSVRRTVTLHKTYALSDRVREHVAHAYSHP